MKENKTEQKRAGAGVQEAKVRQSHDRQWPMWAVIYPDHPTRWFDAENHALLAADAYNGVDYFPCVESAS